MVGLSFFVMLVLPMKEVSGGDSIAIMNCVGMLSIFRQIFKSYQREEQNTAARKLLSFICALTQLAGFVVIIVLNEVRAPIYNKLFTFLNVFISMNFFSKVSHTYSRVFYVDT